MTEMNVPQVQGVLSGLAAPRAAAARGVQPHEVWAVADALLMEGQRPTIERVRQSVALALAQCKVGALLFGILAGVVQLLQPMAFVAAVAFLQLLALIGPGADILGVLRLRSI